LCFYDDISNGLRISFIGHSLGGIIIRTALPYLSNYKKLMFSYLTLSTPHIGAGNSKSFVVNKGIILY